MSAAATPLVCPKCKSKGNEPPGFTELDYPEAIGFADSEMIPVYSFVCNYCDFQFVVPVGNIEIRRPDDPRN